ncbi:hypothetical protein RclHR1_00800011 [Rhizophagus clarus]|nr:hypothetical protein RclHR1_00800011 [Rhizophagus clarus]
MTKKEMIKLILRFGFLMFFEFGLPFALYYILENYTGEILALLLSGIPPLIIVIYGIISKRRVDVMGTLLIVSFIISAVVSLYEDNPRIQLLRKSAVTTIVSLLMIITLIPIKFGTFRMRPFAFYFFRNMATEISNSKVNLPGLTEEEPTEERWERYWVSYGYFRRGFTIMTAILGFGFLLEVPISVIIIYKISSTHQAFLFINILSYSVSIILGILTLICAWWIKKQTKKIAVNNASASK